MNCSNQSIQASCKLPEWYSHIFLLGQKIRRAHQELIGLVGTLRRNTSAMDMAVAWDLLLKQRRALHDDRT